ncbi:DUF6489 family protein [Zavarzinia compransoris]|uniref:Uncharacterized protein n=1 Tax=Zavarzinia compransoris TaxID=1264899 RepID=A0A317E247_9PROT|nr:DUF6489 family protein [Zavarzinia compransoris]PWR20651.1 hypothetical protein DKG75_11655 [Zavarzinia compransoris]TDP44529.1 hypothetical protein DES42_107297 [Zavarzinia compransoris]
MKINVEFDITPEEARRVLGLPDLEPMQQRILAEVEGKMMQYLHVIDPETIIKQWVPMGIQGSLQGFEKLQDFLWSAASTVRGGKRKADTKEETK